MDGVKTILHKEVDGVGVWDSPCTQNIECPYFKANKNYPNQFGGCVDGYCQLPLGLDRVGYRYWNKLTKAHCHNCDLVNAKNNKTIDGNQCCQQQKKMIKKNKLPQFKSPDYMFPDDLNLRNQNNL